jgi:hypothetical protein
MKALFLAFGGSLAATAAVAAGCGGSAFTAGDGGAGTTVDAAVEAATSAESGVEAGEAAPPFDAGPSWCSGRAEMFCEDFDEYPTITNLTGSSTWPTFEQISGSFQFDTVNAPSPPHALQVAGDDGAQVLIVKTFAALQKTPQKVTLTFDLRVNSGGTPGLLSVAGFAAIAFGTSIADGYVAMAIGDGPTLAALWVQSASTNPGDAGLFKAAPGTGTFPSPGVWDGSYAVEISYAPATPPCLQVYRGVSPLLSSCLSLPPEFATPTVLSIALGDVAGGAGHTGQVNLEFDNVTFNVK